MITKKLIPYIIAMLALLCCGCYSDCDFPETIIFPKEGGTMIVDCKYDPAFCSLRDDEGYGEIRYRCEGAENRPPDDYPDSAKSTATMSSLTAPTGHTAANTNGSHSPPTMQADM